MAAIHLLPQSADAADLVMPSKLTGMLASARPVIAMAAPGTQVAKVVAEAGCVVLPGDVAAFVNAIKILAEDEALRTRLDCAGRVWIETEWDKERVLKAFEDELLQLVDIKELKEKKESEPGYPHEPYRKINWLHWISLRQSLSSNNLMYCYVIKSGLCVFQ